MATTKLTLSVDEQVVGWARELSRQRSSSISSMFSRYIQALKQSESKAVSAGPLTREALALGRAVRRRISTDFDEKEVLTQALADKYGVDL